MPIAFNHHLGPVPASASHTKPPDEFPIDKNIPRKLQKKGGRVRIENFRFEVHFVPFLGESKFLGRMTISGSDKTIFRQEFLNKFGKRMKLDDLMDNLILKTDFNRWKINYKVLLAGYHLITHNPERFREVVETAKDEKEFIILAEIN